MVDERSKSIRVTVQTNKAAKTLGAYLELNMDEVVAIAIRDLWAKTFAKIPMPGEKPKGKRSRHKG